MRYVFVCVSTKAKRKMDGFTSEYSTQHSGDVSLKPVLYPEKNDKLLNHIILLKSGGKPWESFLLKATVPLSAFFLWEDRI